MRTRRARRDKWAEAEAASSDVRQRLLDVAMGHGVLTPGLAAEAANEIERLRHAIQTALESDAMMGCEDIDVLCAALEGQ